MAAEMGVTMRRKQQSKLVESLAKKSHFDIPETEDLLGVYRRGLKR